MPEDKNTNLHNLNDETPERERVFEVAPSENDSELEGENSSLFETEKSDVYYEDLAEHNLAQIEAEVEAEQELSEKRKKDKAKARKRDAKAVKDAREKHERDIAEENARRNRMEEERIRKETASHGYNNGGYANHEPYSYNTLPEQDVAGSGSAAFQNNYESSEYQPAPIDNRTDDIINPNEYNYEVQQNNDNNGVPRYHNNSENSSSYNYENKDYSSDGQQFFNDNRANDTVHQNNFNNKSGNYEYEVRQNNEDYGTPVYHNKNEDFKFYDYENKFASNDNQPAPITPSSPENTGAVINEAEYNLLRENYENNKSTFKASGDNVSESVMLQYKESYERFFDVQRQIDQGKLTVLPTPKYETSPSESVDGNRRDVSFNTFPNEQSPQNSYNSHYPEPPRSNSFESNNSFENGNNTNNRDSFSPGSQVSRHTEREEARRFHRPGLNMFEQTMAQYANTVYSQTSNSTAQPENSAPSSNNSAISQDSFVVNSITRARYEALRQKHTVLNNEIASYNGKEVPKETLRKAEQTIRLFSAIESKIASGQLNLVDNSPSTNKGYHPISKSPIDGSQTDRRPVNRNGAGNTPISKDTLEKTSTGKGTTEKTAIDKRVRNSGGAGLHIMPSALGTQVFNDRSKDNFSPRGKRVGDSHINPVGTPLKKYDKLKITNATEFGSPLENASRRSLRAVSSTMIAMARSDQSGSANMALTMQERMREVKYATKTVKDLHRQLKVAYNTVSSAATSARNVGRFLQGKELVAHKDRNPITLKKINKQLTVNPFSSVEKEGLKKKFGTNVSMSTSTVKRKVLIITANNKNLKAEIKALQNKGAALSSSERKKLKSLLDEKKAADIKLRKLHGLKKAQNDALIRNRAADRTSKKSAKKTIKNAAKKKLHLSKKDQAILSRLKDRKNLLDKRKKLLQASVARKQLIFSMGGVLGKAMRESEESTVQGVLGASRVIQNRYVRSILKVSTKTVLLPVIGAKRVAALGLRKLDNKLGVSSAVRNSVNQIKEKALRKALDSKVYKGMHGGVYNAAKNKIRSKMPEKIRTRVSKGKKTFENINSKRKKILDKFNNLKTRMKESKVGRFVTSLGHGFKDVANAFKVVKSVFVKVGLACGSLLLVIVILGAAITSVGGASTSLFFGDDSNDGRIDITSYVKILNDEEQKFLAGIDHIASDPQNKYEKITVNYQSGALVNNFKEILSMTAVYFNQDFTDKTAIKTYLQRLYSDSHYYTQIESEPYSCSGCEDRNYSCYDTYDKFATNKRKSLYASSDHFGEAGVDKNSIDRYGCSYVTYHCTELGHGIYNINGCKIHNGGKVMNKPCSCANCEEVARITTDTKYYCRGYYVGSHRLTKHNNGQAMDSPCSCNNYETKQTTVVSKEYYCHGYCPGTHKDYSCNGHTETICRGEHIDLDINVMVLGFNDIFYADSSVNLSISGIDTATGNVNKGELIGTFTCTHYCTEKYPHICNAGPPYKTASGTDVTPGRTIAVDRSVIPLGTHVIINGHEYIAEDTGGAIKGNRIDIAVTTHNEALNLGTKTYKVYRASPIENKVESNQRNLSLPYLEYANSASTGSFYKMLVLQAFGQAKEPEIEWSYHQLNHDDENSYVSKLQKYDRDNKDEPFTNAELNTFEYVKMSQKDLLKIAKEKTGKDYSHLSEYQIIVEVLIPYDKKHPNEYINDPDSDKSLAYTFEGWTEDNIEWAKNIYSFMDSENYAGLDKINQFSGQDVSYEGVIFEQGETKVVYYSQYDVRWKNLPYGDATIGQAGCGPTSMAMIISSLTDKTVDPIQMCNWSSSKGYYVPGAGTAWSFVPGAASNWGLPCRDMGKGNAQAVVSALSQGKLVIMSTGSGSYYQGDGHFLVLRGVDEHGKILVADPASKVKSETSWTLQQITSGLKNWWIIG